MLFVVMLEQIVNGLVLGAMYALLASGLSLIWGTMRVLNFAQGEMVMLGGYAAVLGVGLGLPLPVAILAAIVVLFFVGAAMSKALVLPLLNRDDWAFATIAVTLGMSIVLQNGALRVFGERFQQLDYLIDGVAAVGMFRLSWQRVLILCVSVSALAAMGLFLKYSRWGAAIRAVAQDRSAAAVCGVDVNATFLLTFGLSAALCALGAGLLGPITGVYPWMGAPLMIKAFAVVVLGGLGSFQGAILAGFLLGILESVGVMLTSSEWRDVISFVVLIAVLYVRPWGLFGVRER
ncbi:MAG: hypothetical protein BGP06_14105 [Rhizobiales bacterium 65-9]|nr:branched-chain amino acid ABC transporter permease [Hyphomicrobiales bacterium]OJY36810.1 MAG: hypothetical protein BGP06_14105 [Rhizobiales bacterium 65-9]